MSERYDTFNVRHDLGIAAEVILPKRGSLWTIDEVGRAWPIAAEIGHSDKQGGKV